MIYYNEPGHNSVIPHSRNPRRAYDERGREIAPMTLQDAMGCGVTALRMTCDCGHKFEVPISKGRWPSTSFVPDAGMTLQCGACGMPEPRSEPLWPGTNE